MCVQAHTETYIDVQNVEVMTLLQTARNTRLQTHGSRELPHVFELAFKAVLNRLNLRLGQGHDEAV